ncbi:MAG TPA: bifunctional 23S rRNA (guanine(2069)-N(7))-methyltransferase RlmK/23S rRNA (guanine(2445)-N(2))-methyltransferase RlmL [Gammaproteobacteria bacterium]|nr:bifunctional 23S rRNA (guanine(2069)-N(7))-methyltransferase RlmK/23S rRNA (guanine(2445)-N(2))-methyltransferase RlmL [Gammaproteobacteria bacterium]
MSETTFAIFATTAKGLEDLLAKELTELGLKNIRQKKGGVHFTGTGKDAMKACLWSRIANRILLEIDTFDVPDDEALYQHIYAINWSTHFSVDDSFLIDCAVSRSNINHSHYASLKAKDAIVDQFREKTGERPTIEPNQPDIRLNLYINNDKAIIYHDLSGESLHKRGYRIEGEHAPLKENLAAAILMRAQWPEKAAQGKAFVDPMCGSGTLVIEALLMAANIAPGLFRERFGFFNWQHFNQPQWLALRKEAESKKQIGLSKLPSITGYDANIHAIRATDINARSIGLDGYIHLEKRDISQATPRKQDDVGLVVVNPPYGQRLSNKPEVHDLYFTMGEQFKKAFPNWDVSVFTDSLELGKRIPLRARKIHSLYNGALECKLLHFHIAPENFFDSNRKFKPVSAERRSESAAGFHNRLKKNIKRLSKWAKRENVSCYRVYDADIPEYAMAIDLYYADKLYVNVQEYEAPKSIDSKIAAHRLNEALSIITEEFSLTTEQLFIKQRKQQKGSQQYEKLSEEQIDFIVVEENNLKFYVNFSNYLDTGLFLDHRITRKMIRDMAAGKDFLNLFCYTGSASVYAAAGGASSTTSVDMSNTYLDWTKRNFALNDFHDDIHQFIREDCIKWMEDHHQKYDLIFLDPPSFSNSKRMDKRFSVQQDQVPLIQNALSMLNANGILIFSNNFRNFKLEKEAFSGVQIEDLTKQTIPEDFKRNAKIHNCWKFTRNS